MKRESRLSALLVCVGLALLAFLVNVSSAAAQANGDTNTNGQNDPNGQDNTGSGNVGTFCPTIPGTENLPPIYCPYPRGLLPNDLPSEFARIPREIQGIEEEALDQWATLGPLMPTGPSQALAGNGVRALQILGKLENYDLNLSVFKNLACATCHMPYAGFTGPSPSLNRTTVALPGSYIFRAGKRKPQSYNYSPYFPVLHYNIQQAQFYGGNFWDMRATGYKLQSPDSEQAQGPPLDPLEMGLPDFGCMVLRLSQAQYRPLFEGIWGKQSFDIQFPSDAEKICSTPAGAFGSNPTPLHLSAKDRGIASATYDAYAHSLTAFENGPEVSPFSSKFDAFLAGSAKLTDEEMAGYKLFRGKANCNSCHLDGRSNAPSAQLAPNGVDTGGAADDAPIFTDTTSSNLGLPKNPSIPFYYENKPDFFGFTPNPAGFGFTDLGVGLFLRSSIGEVNPNADWAKFAAAFDGFMKVPSVRDVGLRPASPNFVKAYMHNGYLKSLKEVVHFYNTRDKYPFPVTAGHCPPGTREKVTCWPMPEVPGTKDMTIGNLMLSNREENQIVAFLETLTDGYTTPFPDFNTYTGP